MRSSITKTLRLMAGFMREAGGSMALSVAFGFPLLLACIGAAIDLGTFSHIQTQLQSAADVAALASVKELDIAGRTDAQIASAARSQVGANIDTSNLARMGSEPVSAAEIDRPNHAVEVSVEMAWRPFFMHFLSAQVTPVRVKARAGTMGRRLVCVLGLSNASPAGVHVKNDGNVTANNCDIYSNTNKPAGLIVADSAKVKADMICVTGGYVGGAGATPKPLTDCPPFPDPLASRSPPSVGACDQNNLVIKDEVRVLSPGVYCGGIKITGKSQVTLSPGVYIMSDGALGAAGTASLKGEDVGVYLTGKSSILDFDSNTTISLAAPTSGPLAGILFFEDRNAPQHRTHRIKSNNARLLLGTIYLPRGTLRIEGGAQVAGDSAYTAIIADNLELREGPALVLNGGFEDSAVPVPEGLVAGRPMLTR
jgi:Putative Flp pilus-assembly TadE/G-like